MTYSVVSGCIFPIKNALFNSTQFYYCFDCIIFFGSQCQIFQLRWQNCHLSSFTSEGRGKWLFPAGEKKHTGGMWPQGRDFGYRQGSEVRGVWQTNTCYWGTKKKRHFESALIKVKAEFNGSKSFLFSQDTGSSLRGVDGIQLPRRSVYPTQPLHPAALGDDTPGSTSLQQTLFVREEEE